MIKFIKATINKITPKHEDPTWSWIMTMVLGLIVGNVLWFK